MFNSKVTGILLGISASFILPVGKASAITINLINPNYTAFQVPCPPHDWCGSIAHFSLKPISFGTNNYFTSAFNAWNAALPAGSQWTKVNGGPLDATINVSPFSALSLHTNHGVGGLTIRATLDYAGADRDSLRWIQGLNLNYVPGSFNLYPPYSTMDDNSLSGLTCDPMATQSDPLLPNPSIWCGPAYPYQYTDERFYDQPKAPYDTGFFEADALLSQLDYSTRTLTVYEGFHYGFKLEVPGPLPALGVGVAFGSYRKLKRFSSLLKGGSPSSSIL